MSLLLTLYKCTKLSAHYVITSYSLLNLAHVKRKRIPLRCVQNLITVASVFLCTMGCVYGASVRSPMKSTTLEDLLIPIFVSLKPEKIYQRLEVTQETTTFK